MRLLAKLALIASFSVMFIGLAGMALPASSLRNLDNLAINGRVAVATFELSEAQHTDYLYNGMDTYVFPNDGTLPNVYYLDYIFFVQPQDEPVVEKALAVGDNPFALSDWVYANIKGTTETFYRPPAVTLEIGYGNCMDKATLLTSMLRYYGYDCYVGQSYWEDYSQAHAFTLFRPEGEQDYGIIDGRWMGMDYLEITLWFDESSINIVRL